MQHNVAATTNFKEGQLAIFTCNSFQNEILEQ